MARVGDELRGPDALEHPARNVRSKAERGSGWYAGLARAGLVAKGVSYGIVGVLAIQLALGEGGEATSRKGALNTLAQDTFGKVLLLLLALGFAAYAIWRFVQAFAEREDERDSEAKSVAKTWAKRAGYLGRGLIYIGLTASAVTILLDSGGGESQNAEARDATATMLGWPAGRWIVGLAGAWIIGTGVWNAYRAVTRKFEEKWRTAEMSEAAQTWGGRAAVAGHLARGVVFTMIGIFVVKAAIEYDPQDAIGLDGALQKLAGAAYGPYLLGLTAAGLVCYGLYCLVDARYRDVSTSGTGAASEPTPAARTVSGHS